MSHSRKLNDNDQGLHALGRVQWLFWGLLALSRHSSLVFWPNRTSRVASRTTSLCFWSRAATTEVIPLAGARARWSVLCFYFATSRVGPARYDFGSGARINFPYRWLAGGTRLVRALALGSAVTWLCFTLHTHGFQLVRVIRP
jgi:hypothetical protein